MGNRRNSSIELLKILGMILIVIFHVYMTVTARQNEFYPIMNEGIDFASLPISITKFVLLIMGYFGNIGNLIFVICSSWFLCESQKTSLQKILSMLMVTFILSITNLIVIHFLYPTMPLSKRYIYECFFPVTYSHNWFITCYILLYLIHAGLNLVINQLSRAYHLLTVSIMFFMYSILPLYGRHNFYYTSYFMVSIMLYVMVSYIKKYSINTKLGIRLLVIGCFGFVYLIISKHFGFPPSIRNEGLLFWAKFSNPFLIFIILGIVLLASLNDFHNSTVNYISGLSLVLYLIHENKTFRLIVRPILWNNISMTFTNVPVLTRITLFSMIVLAYGFGMSMIFNELFMTVINKLSIFVSDSIRLAWNSFCCRYLKE